MTLDPTKISAAATENMQTSMQGFASASKAMQAVTNEMMAMSMESMQRTAKVFEAMQGARSLTDIMRIQTEFYQSAFQDFASRSRRIAELATAAPTQIAKTTKAVTENVTNQAKDAAKSVTDDAKAATVGLDG